MTILPKHPTRKMPTHPNLPNQQPESKGLIHEPQPLPIERPKKEPPHNEPPHRGPDPSHEAEKAFPGVVDPVPPVSPPTGPIIVR